MIQPNELRIGNLVTDGFYESFRTIYKVDSINGKGINLQLQDDGDWPEFAQTWIEPDFKFENITGIPLDESWLRRAKGFSTYKDNPSSFRNNRFILEKDSFRNVWHLRKIMTSETSILLHDEIEFVHQWMNLFFALTGTELEFTEETQTRKHENSNNNFLGLDLDNSLR